MMVDSIGRSLPDLTGQRFGELVVERLCADRAPGGLRRWLCRCDCGKPAIRTTTALRSAVKDGQQPCCHECHMGLWLGSRVATKMRKIEVLAKRYHRFGYLYSHQDDRRERAALRVEMSYALDMPTPSVIDWHAKPMIHCSEEFSEGSRHRTLPARVGTALWISKVESMRRWLRWQTAVDLAHASYMKGLTRITIERILYDSYYRLRSAA